MCNTSTAETNHAQQPTVSVIMATYNGEKYIREQLDSILQQTYPIHEIIIQDDCSTDGTMDILASYAEQYPIIKVERNEQNVGYNTNFKRAAMRATGDFVAISDQDDVWFPQKIERLVGEIGHCDLCFCDHIRGTHPDCSYAVEYKHSFLSNLFTPIIGHAMLLRRSFIQDQQNWTETPFYDWSLLLHAHLGNGVARVCKILNWHRLHQASITHNNHSNIRSSKSRLTAIIPYIKGHGEFRKLQQNSSFRQLYSYLQQATRASKFQSEHQLCSLLLASGPWAYIKLCFFCMAYYREVYPTPQPKGIKGLLRGFFFPAIFAYHSDLFAKKVFT